MANWVEALNESESFGGRAMLSNILYDTKNSHLDDEAMRRFLGNLKRIWTTAKSDNIFSAFCEAVDDATLCRGIEIDSKFKCSRIIEAKTFFENNVDLKSYGARFPLTEEDIKDLLNDPNLPARSGKGEIRGRQKMAWVTQTQLLENLHIDYPVSDPASLVRNRLGLLHYRQGDRLIEIRYGEEVEVELKYPTFLDGCSVKNYCEEPVYRSFRSDDGWGRTLDLETYSEGMPEAVHRPISFGSGFTLHYIGEILDPDKPYNGVNFLESLSISWYDSLPEDLVELMSSRYGVVL